MSRPKYVLYAALAVAGTGMIFSIVMVILNNGWDWGTILLIAGSIVFTILVLVPFIKLLSGQDIKNGVQAEATVIEIWDTGTTINDDPLVGLLLEVHPPGMAPFQVKTKTIISRLSAANLMPGQKANVKYDPANLKRVAVVDFAPLTSPIGTVAATSDRLEELEELHTRHLISEKEYQSKRDEILKGL